MSLTIGDVEFADVLVIDDEPNAREGYAFAVEELGLKAVEEAGPLVEDVVHYVRSTTASGVICDYHLRKKNYAKFDGDRLAAKFYQHKKPVVMCTSYTDVDVMQVRHFRRFIPALLTPNEVDPDSIQKGFEMCLNEFEENYSATRKPWRTLVRVDEVPPDGGYIYVVVPGWSPSKKIRLTLEHLPTNISALVAEGKRFHAQVNVGAESFDDLYFTDWEEQ